MTYTPSTPRNRGAVDLKSLTLKGLFAAGILFVASPALSQPADDPPGCGLGTGGDDDNDPTGKGCPDKGIPVPLAAAGIPALLALGGGFIAVKRRRDSKNKK